MGCTDSRHNFKAEFEGLENYNSIGTSFQGAVDDEPKLKPIDQIDLMFRKSEHSWCHTKIEFDNHLTVKDTDNQKKYTEKLYLCTKTELQRHKNELGVQKDGLNSHSKIVILGKKFNLLDAYD